MAMARATSARSKASLVRTRDHAGWYGGTGPKGACDCAGRKDDKYRGAGAVAALERVEPGQRVLIRNAPPSKLRPLVLEVIASVDHVETVKGAFGPRLPHARHQRHRAVAAAREVGDDRVALRGHQGGVCVLVAYLDAGQQAQMRQP